MTDDHMNGIRAFGAARRYYQGPGALRLVGEVSAQLGKAPLLVCDPIVHDLLFAQASASCQARGQKLEWARVNGEVTRAAVADLIREARQQGCQTDIVLAAGGGKGVDTGKAVARELGARLVVLPTSASNDGPCSKAFVFYDDHHRMESVEQLSSNPDAVIVDTNILVRAPRALLVSGIGDALCKLYEGEQARKAGGRNLFGGTATIAAQHLSLACEQVIREDAVPGLRAVGAGRPDAAFERLTEALVLLSGLAFENSGLSIAHSMTRGLPLIDGTASTLHGQHVAYGLLVQFLLEGRSAGFMAAQIRFYRSVGLPVTLRELGATDVGAASMEQVAKGTMSSPHINHFQRPLSSDDFLAAMQQLEGMSTS